MIRLLFREATAAYTQYKQRCHAFFIDLVSRLCFTDSGSMSTPPEPAAVRRLMGYITSQSKIDEMFQQLCGGDGGGTPRTKKVALYDDAVDPVPVVRSFILQLLLRSELVKYLLSQVESSFVV